MKLIIDIDEEDFNLIRDNIKSYSLADTLFGAVKDGIPYEERPYCGADMGGGIDNAPAVAINKDFYKTDKSNPINRSDLFQ